MLHACLVEKQYFVFGLTRSGLKPMMYHTRGKHTIDKRKNTNIKNNSTLTKYGVTLYNIKRKKYKTVCAKLSFAKATFDRIVMIFFMEFIIFALFAMQLDYCKIKGLYSHKLYFNASKLYQNLEVKIVCHIYNVFKFRGTLSTFPT
jgi:hypothetical protein